MSALYDVGILVKPMIVGNAMMTVPGRDIFFYTSDKEWTKKANFGEYKHETYYTRDSEAVLILMANGYAYDLEIHMEDGEEVYFFKTIKQY